MQISNEFLTLIQQYTNASKKIIRMSVPLSESFSFLQSGKEGI